MTTESMPRRGLTIKPIYLLGIGMVVLAVVLGFNGLSTSFRPYTTSVNEAVGSQRAVQLAGFLGSTGEYDAAGNFTFMLQDNTGTMVKVVYPKPKPSNFEQAVSIVAIGHYDTASQTFKAEDMLVKCPSKYQEQMDTTPAA